MRRNTCNQNNSGLWGGVVLLIVGIVFLLRKLDLHLPDWIFSWPMILIAVGILIGAKNKFQGNGWMILTAIGGIFLVNEIVPWDWNIRRFIWPVILIVLGIYLIGRATTRQRLQAEVISGGIDTTDTDNYLTNRTLFGATKKVILTKDFKGGNIAATFSGIELNFMQADIQGEAVLNVSATFGAIELVVPSHWDLKIDVDTTFGGVEDKRAIVPASSGKVLKLKGSCVFGGIEIKSY
ncbi:LiaF transmembrane domain-containing protein [Chitinophaga lutea]